MKTVLCVLFDGFTTLDLYGPTCAFRTCTGCSPAAWLTSVPGSPLGGLPQRGRNSSVLHLVGCARERLFDRGEQ